MKHTGIHILDFNDKIIDYISRDDGALLNAVMSNNAEEKSETFDFTMLNDRAEHLRERNRIIAQDNNGVYREFIISHVVDNFDGTTDVESNASYLEDIDKSRPIKPGKYSSYSTSQALNETLRNTGWEMSDDTEHGGMRTTSWTSYSTPYEVINMLCTTYGMVAEYYIELGSHTVEHRYVTLKKPVSLFKGKEITKGKDLTGMTRTVDMSEVRTALYAIGPENDTGQRLEKIVTDDDAQAQFGLPGRYLWSVYEPESDDSNMTDERLTTLAKTELNKRNKSAISYEITSTDIHKHYPEMVVSLHDTVRIKDRDFRPPLYIEAEVIGVDYNLLTDESNYKFGNVVEYEENNLRDIFNKKLADISKKLNDNVSNVNTIVKDAVAGELEYFERKIFKQDTPPENPVNDMLWYDTSNPNVAVLRRYWNGEWLNETVDDVEKIGGITREKALLSELQNTFANLSIQHSKILNDTNEVLNSEYLVDTDLKNKLQTEINNIDEIYLSIQSDLNAMTPDTATIGALIDVQSQFSSYRQKLQDLYKAMRDAQVSADKRLQLLQSQYTDEKFNDALNKVATKFGLTIDENNNMVGTPDVIEKAIQASREDTEEQLKSYVKSVDYQTDQNGIVQRLDSADSERLQLSNQISDKVSLSIYNTDKENTDKKLTDLDTSISQNGQEISLRATKEEFNTSKKTLSKVISDFTNNVATGMTFTYDENGAIQLMNIGSDGIKLKGNKVDITVNKDFNVMASKVDDKVGKNEIINRLNLSPEGLDINVNNMGIRGGNNSEYIDIRNTSILSYGSFTRTWANVTDTANLTLGINKGTIQVQNKTTGYNLYLTEKGLSTMLAGAGDETAGTLEFHSTKYNDVARGVRLHSTYGAVAMESDYSRVILNANLTTNIESNTASVYIRPMKNTRVGVNEFRFWTKLADTENETDGVLSYGAVTELPDGTLSGNSMGASLRFEKNPRGGSIIYATDTSGNIGTGSFHADRFIGDLLARGTNAYTLVDSEFRIVDRSGYNGGNPNYKDLRVAQINTTRQFAFANHSGGIVYFGTGYNELRITANNFYNNGNPKYQDIHCKDVISEGTVYYTNGFSKKSSEQYKENIKKWDFNATNSIKNTELYQFNYIDDESKTLQHGVVIERETPQHFVSEQGDSVNSDEILYTTMKALKEQIKRNDKLERRIEILEEQINGK